MWLQIFFSALALILAYFYIDFKRNYKFWETRHVPFLPPTFPTGNVFEALRTRTHFGHIMEDIYTKMKHAGDYCGIFFFREPVLLVLTPEFAKNILVRDFHHFVDRGVYSNERDDPLSANLFFLEGHKWKKLRAKITPVFSTSKLKLMFSTIADVGFKFVTHLKPMAGDAVEIYDLLARFTTDVISSCAFGFESNSLDNPNALFRTMGKRMLNFPKLKSLKIFIATVFRDRARALGIIFNDDDVSNFFMEVVRETIQYRKSTGEKRKDFMQLLIDLMRSEDAADDDKFSFNEIAAQAFVFFFAGFETSSTTLAFTLHSLAFNQDIQQKARDEVKRVLAKFAGEWTYDAVMEMNFVEQVIAESLRLHPPVATIHRMVTKEYTLPNGETLPEGTGVIIPVLALHRDSQIFPNPFQFDPERFDDENKSSRHQFSWLPFGEGQRICIGMRFGLLQTKLVLAMLLNNFKCSPSSKTDNPIKINPLALIYGPSDKVWLKISDI